MHSTGMDEALVLIRRIPTLLSVKAVGTESLQNSMGDPPCLADSLQIMRVFKITRFAVLQPKLYRVKCDLRPETTGVTQWSITSLFRVPCNYKVEICTFTP